MTILVAIVRLVLAGVFVVSAVAKLRDRPGTREGVEAFGVPAALVGAVAAGLPLAEFSCALLLVLPDPFATIGAVGSLVLLLVFTAAIVVNLVQGKHPECHCFGDLGGDSGISWMTVVRNVVLSVLAGISLVGAGGQQSVPATLADLTAAQAGVLAAFAVLGGAVVALALALRTLMGRYGAVLLRLDTLEQAVGVAPPKEAPDFRLPDLDGVEVTLDDVLADEKPAMLVFVSPTCHNCTDLLPDLAAWQSDPDHPFPVVVITDGSVEDNHAKIADVGPLRVLRQPNFSLADSYGVMGTPGAVIVGTDGRIAGAPAHSPGPVRSMHDNLLATMTGASASDDHQHLHEIVQRPVAPGDAVPELSLLSEEGLPVSVDEAFGEDAVVLFWRVDCGFCQGILDEVRALETRAPVRVVSSSDLSAIRATGLVSRVVRDPDGALERWLQVPGTPSAARLRSGVLDSDVVVGGPHVLALMRDRSRVVESAELPH